MRPVRIGILGCGRIVHLVHLGVLTRLPGLEVAALAEPDAAQRTTAARRVPAAVACEDYRDVLAMPDIDAVMICLPNGLHAEAAVAALKRGKHVYLEKPMATSLDEAGCVLDAWVDSSLVGMMGYNMRFNPLYMALQDVIRSGRLGEIVAVQSVFSGARRTLPDWRRARRSGGGALLDRASHHLDLIHFLFGAPVGEVAARVWSRCSEEDSAVLQLRLEGGPSVQSFFSMAAVEEDQFEVYGDAGKAAVDRYNGLDVEVSGAIRRHPRLERIVRGVRALWPGPRLLKKLRAPDYEPSYLSALGAFVAAVRSGRPASPDFHDGYRSLAVIEAAERSARTGRAVLLEARDHPAMAR
jgi:predicted dehydrogenase